MSGLLPDGVRRVLVTGGAGFIGSHLVEALVADDREVVLYDDLSTGKVAFVAHLLDRPGVRLVEADVRDRARLTAALDGVQAVWHLASNVDIPGGLADRRLDLDRSVAATLDVCEAMHAAGVADLLFASSGAVYGELGRDAPVDERSGPLLPVSLYAAGKLSCEAFLSGFGALLGLRAWIFRFGNVVGPRMTRGVIHDFITRLRADPTELRILGDGRQEKPYLLVEDCLAGMCHAYRHARLDAARPAAVFNLVGDDVTPVRRIAEIVAEEMGLTGVALRLTGGERGWPGDQPRIHMRSSAMPALGWRITRPSDEAVRLAARRLLAAPTP